MTKLEAIHARRSVRTFAPEALDGAEIDAIEAICADDRPGPFSSAPRFSLVSLEGFSSSELKAFGTYGMIKGARAFVAGVMKDWDGAPQAMIDYGFCFERIMLGLTALGLGTCWLGGFLHRSLVAGQLGLSAGEIVPAMTPVGRAAESMSLRERLVRSGAQGDRRKPWEEIFSATGGGVFPPEAAGLYRQALEAVRLAPSASNKQPWRVTADPGPEIFHFFLERSPGYSRLVKEADLQAIDLGICLCHFELAARELGMRGRWQLLESAPSGPGEYQASWSGERGGAA